jgi:hypothetical protein
MQSIEIAFWWFRCIGLHSVQRNAINRNCALVVSLHRPAQRATWLPENLKDTQ